MNNRVAWLLHKFFVLFDDNAFSVLFLNVIPLSFENKMFGL